MTNEELKTLLLDAAADISALMDFASEAGASRLIGYHQCVKTSMQTMDKIGKEIDKMNRKDK